MAQGFVDFADAIATSAAAVNPLGGRVIHRSLSGLLSLLHLRLGRWVHNPTNVAREPGGHPLIHALRELFGPLDETVPELHVSDGGHEDNLGLATLVERGCRTIVVLDASEDPGAEFSDFVYCCERLGWSPEPSLVESARPTGKLEGQRRPRLSKRAVFSFRRQHCEHSVHIVLAKLALTDADLSKLKDTPNIGSIVGAADRFPHDPTWNQFIGKERVAAYYALGQLLAAKVAPEIGSAASSHPS